MNITPFDPQHKYSIPRKTHSLYMLLSDCGPQSLGLYGEELARLWLETSGYATRMSRGCDLICADRTTGEVIRVEVKTARRARDDRYHFTLQKENHTDHLASDAVILLCVQYRAPVVPFVVPVSVLANNRQACITANPLAYTGWLSCYRQQSGRLSL